MDSVERVPKRLGARDFGGKRGKRWRHSCLWRPLQTIVTISKYRVRVYELLISGKVVSRWTHSTSFAYLRSLGFFIFLLACSDIAKIYRYDKKCPRHSVSRQVNSRFRDKSPTYSNEGGQTTCFSFTVVIKFRKKNFSLLWKVKISPSIDELICWLRNYATNNVEV